MPKKNKKTPEMTDMTNIELPSWMGGVVNAQVKAGTNEVMRTRTVHKNLSARNGESVKTEINIAAIFDAMSSRDMKIVEGVVADKTDQTIAYDIAETVDQVAGSRRSFMRALGIGKDKGRSIPVRTELFRSYYNDYIANGGLNNSRDFKRPERPEKPTRRDDWARRFTN